MNHLADQKEIPVQPSYRRHKRQKFWQILVPIGVGILLVFAVMTLIILSATRGGTGSNVSGWADASLIWLILPVLAVAFVVAVLLFALVYLLARALKILPVYSSMAQYYVGLVAQKVREFSDWLTSPLIRIKSSLTGVGRVTGKRHRE